MKSSRGKQLWNVKGLAKNQSIKHLNLHCTRAQRKYIRLAIALISATSRGDVMLLSDDDHAYMNFQKQGGLGGGRDGSQITKTDAPTGKRKSDYSALVNLISSPQNVLHISLHPILDVNPVFNDTYFAGKIDQFCPS